MTRDRGEIRILRCRWISRDALRDAEQEVVLRFGQHQQRLGGLEKGVRGLVARHVHAIGFIISEAASVGPADDTPPRFYLGGSSVTSSGASCIAPASADT